VRAVAETIANTLTARAPRLTKVARELATAAPSLMPMNVRSPQLPRHPVAAPESRHRGTGDWKAMSAFGSALDGPEPVHVHVENWQVLAVGD
jgi:hypothetical protein